MIKKPIFIPNFLPLNNRGYTLLELLIVICLFMFLSGGIYSMYSFFNYENSFVQTMKQLTRNNRTVMKMFEFDIKMAGFIENDSKNGIMEDPIMIFDSLNTCCDSIEIKYDLNADIRIKLKYEVEVLNNENYLFKTKLVKNGSNWSSAAQFGAYTKQVVAKNLEDLQFQIHSGDTRGNIFLNPCLGKGCEIGFVDIYILSKSTHPLLKQKSFFTKSNFYPGNYIYSKTDKFLRKESYLRLRTRNISPYIYHF